MEEDIKIIEEYIKHDTDLVNLPEYDAKIVYKAIENLIAGYKELEEENESLQKTYDDCYCKYKHYKQFESISVQKVIDKMEELKNGKDFDEDVYWEERAIDVLQELLESEV